MGLRLTNINVSGYKSIRALDSFDPGNLTVLVGANGAGKSNFLSFFRLMHDMLSSPGELQLHIGKNGGANTILHDGAATTQELDVDIRLEGGGAAEYAFRLAGAAGDTLIFSGERFRVWGRQDGPTSGWAELGAGHRESMLPHEMAGPIRRFFERCPVFQLHNTSMTSRLRMKWPVHDNQCLKEDAGNLAPFLLRLREDERAYYDRILGTVRQVAPFIADFVLEPEHDSLMLRWREVGSDLVFNASQAPDGLIRAISLIALLLQPERDLPPVVIVDEPELGLHPYAITVVAGLLHAASHHAQVLVATQSSAMLDHFDPEHIVVVDRVGRESRFKRLDPEGLKGWLEDYSIAELWEKNVIGGRPAR